MAAYRHMYVCGPHGCPQVVGFWPSKHSTRNEVAAVVHRVGRFMPTPNPDVVKDFMRFAKAVIRDNIDPIRMEDIPDFKEWAKTYTGSRREVLEATRARLEFLDPKKDVRIEGFIKYESYPVPKQPRGILSFSDAIKVLLGPLCRAIDKQTFYDLSQYFVKGTDPKTWPRLMLENFADAPVFTTDFSNMEAHHSGFLAEIEYYWMAHVIRNLPGHRLLRQLLRALILGDSKTKFSHIVVEFIQRMKSGALWTSSGNGILNFLLNAYLNLRSKYSLPAVELAAKIDEFRGLFEGDDGIQCAFDLDPSLIPSLGLQLKMERAPNFAQAGFCSIYCDAMTLECVKDPMRVLQTFFALPPEFFNASKPRVFAYLRAKALSYKYLFPSAPIIGPMMDWVLYHTRDHQVRQGDRDKLGWFYSTLLDRALAEKAWRGKAAVTAQARALVSDLFHIPVDEQLRIESAFHDAAAIARVDLSAYLTPEMEWYVAHFLLPTKEDPAVPHANDTFVDHVMASGGLDAAGEAVELRIRKYDRIRRAWQKAGLSIDVA